MLGDHLRPTHQFTEGGRASSAGLRFDLLCVHDPQRNAGAAAPERGPLLPPRHAPNHDRHATPAFPSRSGIAPADWVAWCYAGTGVEPPADARGRATRPRCGVACLKRAVTWRGHNRFRQARPLAVRQLWGGVGGHRLEPDVPRLGMPGVRYPQQGQSFALGEGTVGCDRVRRRVQRRPSSRRTRVRDRVGLVALSRLRAPLASPSSQSCHRQGGLPEVRYPTKGRAPHKTTRLNPPCPRVAGTNPSGREAC